MNSAQKLFRYHKKTAVLVFVIVIPILLSFVLWRDSFSYLTNSDNDTSQEHPILQLPGMTGIGLLIADLFLPIPNSIVISLLGRIYGGFAGGLYATTGLVGAGLLGYLITRIFGSQTATKFLSEESLKQLRELFDNHGMLLIATTRPLPIIPEVLFCLAGLCPMSFWKFSIAILAGSAPTAFVFSFLGSHTKQHLLTMSLAICMISLFFYFISKKLLCVCVCVKSCHIEQCVADHIDEFAKSGSHHS